MGGLNVSGILYTQNNLYNWGFYAYFHPKMQNFGLFVSFHEKWIRILRMIKFNSWDFPTIVHNCLYSLYRLISDYLYRLI